MKKIYGSLPATMPEGYAYRVRFPNMATMDLETGDHRRLASEGGSSRDGMPHQIRFQPAATFGHDGALPVGAVFTIEFDTDTGGISGEGYLIDEPMGHFAAKMIATKTQHKNSIDLNEVKAEYVEDMDDWSKWYINFTQWKIGATTLVGTPAFAEAHAEIVASLLAGETMAAFAPDELLASFVGSNDNVLVCEFPAEFEVHADLDLGPRTREVTADGLPRTPYDAYFRPESDFGHKIRYDDGTLYGHLGLWETCHDGMPGCFVIPRPNDGYASFNKAGALTDKGQIGTGPIFALGGHRTLIGVPEGDEAKAYGSIENAWADVRISEGRFGPWLSGHVRPGVDPVVAYAAVASRISGHWKGSRLKAIVSVNSEGYDTDDSELAASFVINEADGEVELFASFPPCMDKPGPDKLISMSAEDKAAIVREAVAAVRAEFGIEVAGVPAEEDSDRRRAVMALLLGSAEDDADSA